MQGLISFHPIDLEFFAGLIDPLVAGDKVNPEAYLESARRYRTGAAHVGRYREAIVEALEGIAPPAPPSEGPLWHRVRARLERFDHRPDPLALLLRQLVEPELHLEGRPFFVTEGSVDRVVSIVDEYLATDDEQLLDGLVLEQLIRLDKRLGHGLQPADTPPPDSPMSYRSSLLESLKALFDLGRRAREGEAPASKQLADELAWRALDLHARARPFWVARDVDGLGAICDAAGVPAPPCLQAATRLLPRAVEEFSALRGSLDGELRSPRDVGAFVAPNDLPELLSFLASEGSRIIRAAARHDVGETCELLLRKIRECAGYAERHGLGYLEGAGIGPIEAQVAERELATY